MGDAEGLDPNVFCPFCANVYDSGLRIKCRINPCGHLICELCSVDVMEINRLCNTCARHIEDIEPVPLEEHNKRQ